MKKISVYGFALLAIFVLVLAQGCKSPVDVVGKWAEIDGSDKVEFTAAGTFSGSFLHDSAGAQKTIGGKYTVSGEKVTLTAQDDAKDSMVWKVSRVNDVLSVVFQNGGAPKLDGSAASFRKAN